MQALPVRTGMVQRVGEDVLIVTMTRLIHPIVSQRKVSPFKLKKALNSIQGDTSGRKVFLLIFNPIPILMLLSTGLKVFMEKH